MDIKIAECFYSIQGEGIHQQIPTVFVRLQGCNLRCRWCDTAFSIKESGKSYSIDKLADEVVKLNPHTYQSWVCITGGEPLTQPEALLELVRKLKDYGYKIEVFTNGSIEKPRWYTLVDSWVVDIKTPSSGEAGKSLEASWFDTRICDQIKFVVADQKDLDFVLHMTRENATKSPVVLVSPMAKALGWDQKWLQEVWKFCLEERVRFSLQVQRVVFGDRKGV